MAKKQNSKGTEAKKSTGNTGTGASNSKRFEFPESIRNLHMGIKPTYFRRSEPDTLLQGQIVTIDRFFSSSICDELIKAVLSPTTGIPLETTPLIKSREYAARVNDRCVVIDPQMGENLWKYLYDLLINREEDDDGESETTKDWIQEEFEEGICLNPQFRMYRYRAGQYFEKHYDESVSVKLGGGMNGVNKSGKTKWTLLIYLTGGDEFEGGGTIFYNHVARGRDDTKGVMNVHPSKGMALLHKHGDDCLLHEAEPVGSGEKWVLRSDVVF